jgi:hypothetical protein
MFASKVVSHSQVKLACLPREH